MSYPSDISESQWEEIAHYFELRKPGRPSIHNKRDIFNAILYINKTGCQWRLLPKDFPPWRAVHSRYEYWCYTQAFDKALSHLNRINRMKKNMRVEPSLGIIDSQSVKTANVAENRGFDGNKKVKGRKRHIVVDTLGQLLSIHVHAANQHDSPASKQTINAAISKHDSIKAICGDSAYNGTATIHVIKHHRRDMIISKKIKDQSVSPKRWIVERTFAWLSWYGRVNVDYEKLSRYAENMVRITMIAIGLKKLSKS